MRKVLALVLVVVLVLAFGAAASAAPKWTFKMGHANPPGRPTISQPINLRNL